MRISYYATGKCVTLVYATWAVIHGSIEMSHHATVARNANNVLDAAQAKWKIANDDYLASQHRLDFAQSTINDAGCYIKQYSSFAEQLNIYCLPANSTTRQNQQIESYYGFKIAYKPTDVSTSQRRDSYTEYYYDDVRECSTDSYGNSVCKTVRKQKRRTVYYTVNGITYSHYGTLVSGAGSEVQMGCGLYEHSMHVASRTWLKSDTGMILKDKYNEEQTKIYSSSADIDITIDSTKRPIAEEINSGATNFDDIAAMLLQIIMRQCAELKRNLKQTEYYSNIIAETTQTLPALRDEINRTLQILNAAATFRDGKLAIYQEAEADYQQSLATWLPVIFVPTLVLISFLAIYKDVLKEKFIDTEEVCAPKAKLAIPVALTFSFRSNRHTLPIQDATYAPDYAASTDDPPQAIVLESRTTEQEKNKALTLF